MRTRILTLTLLGLAQLLAPARSLGLPEIQLEVTLWQDFLSGDLRSRGHAYFLGETTATLSGEHTIQHATLNTARASLSFSNRSEYLAVIWATSYTFGHCYQGTLQAFVPPSVGTPRARSAEVCPQRPPSTGGEEEPPLNQDPECECDPEFGCSCSPILIDMQGNGFRLSGADDPVVFDIDAVGSSYRISWTARDTDDAFLVLDRNGNGLIDDGSELFGSATPQPPTTDPNGFLALAVYDSPEHGGNLDGKVSRDDAIFDSLLLWTDTDHDAISEPWELTPLRDSGIQAITLDYHRSRRSDRHGNWYRWAGRAELGHGFRSAIDVIFVAD